MNSKELPLVSIISVNFNQPEITGAFLDSLKHVSYPNFEVIVVDNGSSDHSIEFISKNYKDIQLIESKENLGFAGGNNIGIRAAKGKYFMFLNNDTEVDPGFLEPLVEHMETNEDAGMVGSKVRFYSRPDTIQFAGATPMTRFSSTSHFLGNKQKDVGQYEEITVNPYASGAAMMTSRKVCKEVGLMATFFFLYYEELDWQERIRAAGYKIYYIPNSLILHKESVSVGKESALQAYWRTRNRFLLIRRNRGNYDTFMSIMYMTFVSTPVNLTRYILRRNMKAVKVHFIAIGWHYWNLFNFKRIHQNEYLD